MFKQKKQLPRKTRTENDQSTLLLFFTPGNARHLFWSFVSTFIFFEHSGGNFFRLPPEGYQLCLDLLRRGK
jgi:hypothetical protein